MPSFSIEVAGEANPLTENLLVRSLTSAASSDQNQIQTGTKQLEQWEKSPGFYRHLQSAYLDDRLPLEIRYLAIIQLKNGIDKYWRKTALNAVSKEDKEIIRSRLLDSALNETDDRLALQNALLIAKIARSEYPNDWPDALSSVANVLRSQAPPLQLARALLVLLHIVKELSTGRLQRTRQNLQAATPEILHVLGTLYATSVSSWQSHLEEATMKQSLLAIKVLRRLIIHGYEHPNRDAAVASLWQLTQQHLATFMQYQEQQNPQTVLIDKHMVQLAKLHHEMAREHPAAFALLPNSIELVRSYWALVKSYGENFGSKEAVVSAVTSARIGLDGDADEDKPTMEKLALKGLLIIRACAKMVHNPAQTFKHRTPQDKEEKSKATELIKNELLTQPFVKEVMEIIVTRFFVFRASDLREWEEEPEEWEKREEGEGEDWEFSVRSCSEKLFLDLAINYKDLLVQPLLAVFYSVATPENENILFKDSVYTAIGLAAPVVQEQLDFDAFIRQVLAVEVEKQLPGYNIIRRRAAILLGQWIAVKISDDTRPTVYEIFQHLLDKQDSLNDQVVRVTAGRQFKTICDDWEFKVDHFMPYAETTLLRLMQLIEEVELTETKMALLDSISNAVVRLEHRIAPFAERIVNMLPSLWAASGDEHLMKQAILTILARLVNALKADGLPLHMLAYPIIRGAVEPGSETQVYLLDDAMDLWADVVVQTPTPASPELLAMVRYLYPIYELGSENLRKALEITASYILLAPEYMLAADRRIELFGALAGLLGSLRPDANGLVCNLLEMVIRSAEQLGAEGGALPVISDLVKSGIVEKLLKGLKGSWTAHCTTGPNRKEPPVDGIMETDYLSIIARIILASTHGFIQITDHFASDRSFTGAKGEQITDWLLEEWFSHFENVGDPSRRKLMCLALTQLLETNRHFILVRLQSLMTVWTDVITELRDSAEETTGDSLVYSNGDQPTDGSMESPEDARRRQWTYSDAVHTANLPAFVTRHLQQAIQAAGGLEIFQQEWLVNVDQDILAAFSAMGII
ncbi:armadillo-type protein [Neohortaea acidophila]|uniref:Armadillo-type protein n=1 Tax=Neohortaea acidophila TaxID=245834 RepID=A0A6A6PL55_9PEZI|nr:armadillo-type protein [Neohortaea acidophila]KAF2480394.1 armadillo-type protein [Neohortaea acidophila]